MPTLAASNDHYVPANPTKRCAKHRHYHSLPTSADALFQTNEIHVHKSHECIMTFSC